MKTTRATRSRLLSRWMPGIILLAGLFLLGALPHAAAQYFGSAIRAGTTTNEVGSAIARDAAGNVYVTGSFLGTVDFNPELATANLTSAGGSDIFVAKYTPTGDLIWARRMGGGSADEGAGIAVDASGNVLITGFFSTTADFDPGQGTFNLTSAGLRDIFVSKLTNSGNFVLAAHGWHWQ